MIQREEIDLAKERKRIEGRMDELADEQVKYDEGTEKFQELLVQGNELNNQVNILKLVEEEWGTDSITLTGLTSGRVNLVEDTADSHSSVRERDAWVAAGTVDAPYVEHDPDAPARDRENFNKTVANITDLPLSFVRWAEGKISELSHLSEAEGNGYLELVRDRQDQAQSESVNG